MGLPPILRGQPHSLLRKLRLAFLDENWYNYSRCRRWDLNPHEVKASTVFETVASACSATSAREYFCLGETRFFPYLVEGHTLPSQKPGFWTPP